MGPGWWSTVIQMYTDMTRDITHIVDSLIERYGVSWLAGHPEMLQQLHELLQRAPNTDPHVRQIVDKEWEMAVTIARSFEMYADEDIMKGKGRPH